MLREAKFAAEQKFGLTLGLQAELDFESENMMNGDSMKWRRTAENYS